MTTARAFIVTEKSTGRKFVGEVRQSWGKASYSFDGGDSWAASKASAFLQGKLRGRLFEHATLAGQRSEAQ